MFKQKLLIFIVIVISSFAVADCQYNGSWYPEGATIGPYICVNGNWVRR